MNYYAPLTLLTVLLGSSACLGTTHHALSGGTPSCPIVFAQAHFCAALTWVDSPVGDLDGELTLRFWNPDEGNMDQGPFVDPSFRVELFPFMPSMGHGTYPAVVTELEYREVDGKKERVPGNYRVKNLHFIMGGKWDLIIKFYKPDETAGEIVEEGHFEVQI